MLVMGVLGQLYGLDYSFDTIDSNLSNVNNLDVTHAYCKRADFAFSFGEYDKAVSLMKEIKEISVKFTKQCLRIILQYGNTE